MAIALKISGTSYTLPQASVRSLVHTVQACQPAKLVAQIYAPAIPTTTIQAFAEIELWVDSVRRFAGTLTTAPRLGYDAQGSYIELTAADVLARLRSITYERPVLTWTGITSPAPAEWGFPEGAGVVQILYKMSPIWSSAMTLFSGGIEQVGTDTDGTPLYGVRGDSSSAAELARMSSFLARHGIDFELGTIAGLPSKNTGDVVTDLDCLSAIQRCANLRPDAVFWIDPSGGTNRLNYITRDNCTEVTLDCASRDRITANECAPRDDLQVGYIKFKLNWQVVRSDGSWYPNSNVYEYGDSTCQPERRLVRTFDLGKFADSTATTGLPYVCEVPTGAAAAYWAAASVLHYEGSCSVYEPDGVSYAYSLGQVVNFSNWQPGYETARALVRGVTYDLVARRTSIDFGPPDSLTPQAYLSIAASSLGSSSPTTDPTDPTTDPSDPSAPGAGDLPAQVTGMLYEKFAVESTTGAVQVVEGIATLVGTEAFTNPETPPVKYLLSTLSGEDWQRFSMYVSDCASLPEWIHRVFSGGCSYGAISGVATSTGHCIKTCNNGERYDLAKGCGWRPTAGELGYGVDTITSTSWKHDITTGCVNMYPGSRKYSGYCLLTLSNPDTDQNAIARLGDTWVTPTELSLRTFWEQRTTGFSFSVRRCRLHGYTWTCSIYGLPVKVSIPLYKYAIGGTKPSTPTATQEFELPLVQLAETTTGAHGLTLTVYKGKATLPDWEMPIEKGYVIEAGNISITLL